MKKYKTKNLDEATFLILKGYYSFKQKVISAKGAEFTFEDTDGKIKNKVKEFWCGSPVISLNKWTSTRTQLKTQQSQIFHRMKNPDFLKENGNKKYPSGMPYYYIDDFNHIQHSIFGVGKAHQDRAENGNVFLSTGKAQTALKERK